MRFQHTLVDFARLDEMAEDTAESEAFAEKFKPKKTSDDVYTPPEVYDAVLRWVERTYGLPEDTVIVRPFYPGGNYLTHDYPEGCLVLDNPPFSLMAKIVKFYTANRVRFFLFANTLTLFQQIGLCNAVVCGYTVTYENGAGVNTSFLTSLGDDRITVSGELYGILDRVQDDGAAPLPKYDFPPNVLTAARLTCIAMQGGELRIRDALPIKNLDGAGVFGGGALIDDEAAQRAAAQRAAAQRAAAQRAAAQRAAIPLRLLPKDANRLATLNRTREGRTAQRTLDGEGGSRLQTVSRTERVGADERNGRDEDGGLSREDSQGPREDSGSVGGGR